jgi:predicted phage terminase large subunit-like protein
VLLYLPHHLRGEETGNVISLSGMHLDWVRHARSWIKPIREPREYRHAFIAPRSSGKTTWFYLGLPMWAAAHGWVKFLAAFADSAPQAEIHLSTFKHELDTNDLLREDYPDLCTPAKRQRGVTVSDHRAMLFTQSGFVFSARGADSKSLGLKVGNLRPDLILCDDIEPGEASYSPGLAEKRLGTLQDDILPLNAHARVVLTGTVTMPGSITHQLVKYAKGVDIEDWIKEEGFVAHHYRAIVTDEDGRERSIWPAKWTISFLCSIRHTRSYRKNYDNDPMASDGDYFSEEDFSYGKVPAITKTLLSIDPAVTTNKGSDPTALVIVGYSPTEKRCEVSMSVSVKLVGEALRKKVLEILNERPEIRLIFVEVNQGGELWNEVFHDMPVKVRVVHQSEPKHVRLARVLSYYQRGRVSHRHKLPSLEEQMVGFPKVPHDDEADAAGTGISYFLDEKPKKKVSAVSRSYVA